MQYISRDGILTEMADWFFDPSVTDEQEMAAALSSIPDANTWFVFRSALVARYKAIPYAARSQPPWEAEESPPEGSRRRSLVDRKWELINAERILRNRTF